MLRILAFMGFKGFLNPAVFLNIKITVYL